MQVKLRFSEKRLQNYTKFGLEIGPKYLQNGAKNGPKTIPNSFPKICRPNVAKMTKKTTKNDFKMEPKIRKKPFWALFFSAQKKVDFLKLFFLSFYSLREALDPGNQAKTL